MMNVSLHVNVVYFACGIQIHMGHMDMTRLADASFACIAQWLCHLSSMGLYLFLCGCTSALLSSALCSSVMILQSVVVLGSVVVEA